MDQRVKGGSPPKTTADATSAPKSSEKDHVPEKKRKAGAEEENGDKGAVLELLIEGRCGTKGDQQLQLSGKDTSCPEGNVRLRIGLQAKRTKKPPKILESYVCKPTIRTYQRQGRGALRGEAEGGVGHQSKTSSNPDEATSREQHSGLDSVQTTSKQTASAPPVAPSSLSASSSTSTTTTTLQPLPPSAPATAALAQRNKSSSQVPIKLAEKAEAISNGTSEKVKKSSLVNGLSVAHKISTPKTDSKSQIPSPKSSQTEDIKSENSSSKKHNGLVQASKQKGQSNEKGTANTSNASSEKGKSGKHNTTPSISSTTKLTADSSQKEVSNNSKSPSISAVTSSPPTVSQPQDDPLMQPTVEKRKDKKKKSKKEKRRDRKSKRDRLEGERAKSRSEKKKERGREEKTKHGKDQEEWHKSNDVKKEQAPSKNDKTSSQECQIENSHAEISADINSCVVEEVVCDAGQDEDNSVHVKCREVEPVETTGDTSKSKEQDISRHSTAPASQPISTPPASLPAVSSAPSSPPEQDSRPLKKRKARRPSWTKLVHRAQKAENHEATLDSQRNPSLSFPQNPKTSLNPRAADESHAATSSTVPKSSSPPSTVTRSPSPKQASPEPTTCATKAPLTPTRKRGRPKSQTGSYSEPPAKLSPNVTPTEVPIPGQDSAPSPPAQLCLPEVRPSPRKRGRPPKRPLPNDAHSPNALSDHERRCVPNSEKGNKQLNIRRLINEMKKRKKRRFHKVMSSAFVAKAADAKSIEATTVHTLSSLSSSFGGKLGPQINVSKRGTIYMGKRRGRKPKVQISHSSSQSSLFTSAPETSLFSQPPPSHPFPSPSLTHSSGAQSPYSEHSFTDPSPCLLFSQPFSLPSPSSSCTSPRPPSSSSLSSFVRKSCPCQGRPHFPFHQSTCKLSTPAPSLQHAPGSPPGHLKEATTSPRSESHSEETLPSDSGIGTDNNSICERGEMRGSRGMLRVGHSILGGQKHPASILDQPSPVSPPLLSRHPNPNAHRDRHRHRRRDFDCSSSCACLCACSGQSKCIQSDFYSCHNTLKRQKSKHKKKHQQNMHLQDPEFLSELEDVIALFSEMHIGRRSWARAGLAHGYDGGSSGGRRHHSSHSIRSNIFRINLNGFYSPHPSTYSHNPSIPTQPFYSCHPVHCSRKLDRRQCGCSSKFQDSVESMYRSYPSLYNHLPNSYALPSPSQFALHQSPHFFLNPARFHRRRSRLMRGDDGIGGEEGPRGSGHLGSGLTSNFSCGCGRSEHKHKHKHRHRHCDDDDDDIHEDEVERERFVSKQRSGFLFRQEEIGRKTSRGLGSVLSKESPWLRQNGSDSFSSVAASSSTERFKQTPLSSVGLGSTHLSSFGGGWGALGHSWTKFSGLGASTFGKPSWTGFNSEKQHANKTVATGAEEEEEEEDDDDDDDNEEEASIYRTSPPPVHTNLFTSAAMEAGARGLRWGGDRPWRRAEPVWMERREAGSHSDSRNWGSQKTVQPSDNGSLHKRRPGRPRKHPVSSAVSPPVHSTSSGFMSAPEVQAGTEAARRERADPALLMTEAELQAKRKKGRQRRHSPSPLRQSVTEDRAECESPTESSGHSDVEQAPSQPVPVPTEEDSDRAPRKSFLKAGLYSDDYKTTDPPSQNTHFGSESTEYSPEEQDYSLLPAPIHVGKYLRLKRIHFQLPYDVMWLWRHEQLCRPPVVPLKRKRRYCRPKEKTLPSHENEDQTGDITSLFPHLDMDPLSSCERSFVVKHHVFLLRNWELVRERQIRLRIERERQRDSEEEEEEEERAHDRSHIKSDQPTGEESVFSRDSSKSQDTSSSLTASPCPTKAQSGPEEKEEDKRGEEDVCRREQRRKRLSDLLLTLQHS